MHRILLEPAEEPDENVSLVGRDLVKKGSNYDDLEGENARLQNRVETLIETREEQQELVRYVEDEHTAEQRRCEPGSSRARSGSCSGNGTRRILNQRGGGKEADVG